MSLDISSLEKAISSFVTGLDRYQKDTTDLEVRDGCIQRFECTYELATKLLRRQLEINAAIPQEIDEMSFKGRIRLGAEKGLIDSPEDWFEYREKRNITSHTYDESKANELVEILPKFARSAEFVFQQLKRRNEA